MRESHVVKQVPVLRGRLEPHQHNSHSKRCFNTTSDHPHGRLPLRQQTRLYWRHFLQRFFVLYLRFQNQSSIVKRGGELRVVRAQRVFADDY